MSLIINIETSTNICSVAISQNDKLLSLKETDENNAHSKLLAVLINKALSETNYNISDIDAVAVSQGPGSYTGLRIGVSTAKGICYALNKPLIAIDTLQILAINIFENSKVANNSIDINDKLLICSMIDARRMEVYSGLYNRDFDTIKQISADIITNESYSDILSEHIVLIGGSGAEKCKDILNHKNAYYINNVYSSAKYMLKLSSLAFKNKVFVDTAYFEPFYLKQFIAGTPKKMF